MIHSTNKSNSIVFIDAQVNDYQGLIAGINAQTNIVILNNSQNGIEQITKALELDTYTEVHLISHGSPGCLYLGNEQLNLSTLNSYKTELKTWFPSSMLSPCSSLLIYGCNVAAGDAGAEFIARLKEFTGAEIAATKTLTGNQAMGGDWELETTTADLSINLAIAASVREAYQGVLADFVVTTADDENDGDVDGDDLSLREAIIAANNTPGADTITFDDGISQINLTSETLSITDSLTINGSGANSLKIDGGNQDFAVITIGDDNLNATINVTIDGVTITGGNNAESGGGIRNLENLALNNSVVSGNASGKDGGGIFNLVGTFTTDNTIIKDNTAAYGGGVSNYFGSTSLTNSTISGNTALNNGGGLYNYAGASVAVYSKIEDNSAQTGGGISNYNGAIAVVTSVISGNTASENGGGIYNQEGQATVTLSYVRDNNSGNFGGGIASQNEASTTIVTSSIISGNTADFGAGVSNYQGDVSVSASTISGNRANIEGGGVNNYFGTSNLTNSTISGNSAIAGGGVSNFNGQTTIFSSTIANNAAYYGSGIINYYSQTILASTIVAGNQNSPDVLGRFFTSAGNNLIGNRGDVTTLIDGENNDLVGTSDNPIDPLLGDLQDNGGLTPTQALLPGSPAIDRGADLEGIDQRGGDFVRPVGLGNDIGAFEVQNPYSTPEDDYLVGGINDNVISAREGNDLIFGLDGDDILNGDAGNDTIYGGNDEDRMTGGAGHDVLEGDAGNDVLNGGAGNDTVRGGTGEDRINGGAGDDLIQGNAGRDTLNGDNGNDTIVGGIGDDTLNGGNGIDVLLGSEGNDSLWGGKGRDSLNGGTGNDILRGHDDDDILNGGEGIDKLYGANGNDILNGGAGSDTVSGGAGNDLINGGEGKDALHGGAGNDIFFLDADGDNDFIADFTDGIDRFQLSGGLHFGSLSFHDNFNNSATIIKDASNNYEIVATVRGIHAEDLNAHDFTNA